MESGFVGEESSFVRKESRLTLRLKAMSPLKKLLIKISSSGFSVFQM
jgi:hypothetical protein